MRKMKNALSAPCISTHTHVSGRAGDMQGAAEMEQGGSKDQPQDTAAGKHSIVSPTKLVKAFIYTVQTNDFSASTRLSPQQHNVWVVLAT